MLADVMVNIQIVISGFKYWYLRQLTESSKIPTNNPNVMKLKVLLRINCHFVEQTNFSNKNASCCTKILSDRTDQGLTSIRH